MNRRNNLTLVIVALAWLCLSLPTSTTVAQQATDLEGVKAASNAFYEALALRWQVCRNGAFSGRFSA
jgi:hypothetical protein